MLGRRAIIAAAVPAALAGALVLPDPAAASGGGGCGRPVTDGEGTAVAIRNFCFTPTVLHAEAGAEVSFDNRDREPHNVLGANGAWGSFEQLRRDGAAYRFDEPGVYPYACTLHPGMIGAVVVGEAASGGAGGGVVEVLDARPAANVALVRGDPPLGPTPGASPWPTATATLGMVALSLAILLHRRRRAPSA